jgi:hypothetical protein
MRTTVSRRTMWRTTPKQPTSAMEMLRKPTMHPMVAMVADDDDDEPVFATDDDDASPTPRVCSRG